MKTYTEKEVDKLIRTAVNESVLGTMDWVYKETLIEDKKTGKEIKGAQLNLIPNSKKPLVYVWKRLAKKGIKFTNPNIKI